MTRTWSDFPFRLECGDTGKAAHSEEVEKRLGRMEYDGRLRDDHLCKQSGTSARVSVARTTREDEPRSIVLRIQV